MSVGRCLQFFYTGLVAALATPWILISFSQVCDAHPWKVKWSSTPAHLPGTVILPLAMCLLHAEHFPAIVLKHGMQCADDRPRLGGGA